MLAGPWQVAFLFAFQPVPRLLLTSLALVAPTYHVLAPLLVLLPAFPRPFLVVLSFSVYLFIRFDVVPYAGSFFSLSSSL